MNANYLAEITSNAIGNEFHLIGEEPLYTYKDNKKTDAVCGTTYRVVSRGVKCPIDVKILGPKQLTMGDKFLARVEFADLQITYYAKNNECLASAKATAIRVVSNK